MCHCARFDNLDIRPSSIKPRRLRCTSDYWKVAGAEAYCGTEAATIGASTLAVIRAQSARRLHPHESIRSALGIVRLAKDFTTEALKLACARALKLNATSYRSVRNLILRPPSAKAPEPIHTTHEHVRSADYFAGGASC